MSKIVLALCVVMMAFSSLNAQEGNLQIVNVSPDTSLNLISVMLEDSVIIDSLAFNEATAYITVPAGDNQTLKFMSVTYPDETFELNGLNIDSAGFFQSILFGVQSTTGYAFNPEGIDRMINATFRSVDTSGIADGNIKVNFFHAVADAVELDVAEFLLEYIVDDMAFTEYSNTETTFEIESRKLFFTSTDSSVAVASRTADLTLFEGNTLTILLSGFLIPSDNRDGPAFGIYGVDGAGNVIELDLISNVSALIALNDITLYPNPAHAFVRLSLNAITTSEYTLTLVSLDGKESALGQVQTETGNNQFTLKLPNVAPGMYFIRLINQDGQGTLPIIIQ